LKKYQGSNLLDADVYLTGHHGSKNGTTQELLDRVTPKMALIGMGDLSRHVLWTAWAYGHPNKGILDMLQKSITTPRVPSPIKVKAGTGAKTFVDYTVSKAIYTTGWDDSVVLQADATGHWAKVDPHAEPTVSPDIVPSLVNVNTANETELETLPGIGNTKASAIVKYRSRHGNFSSVDDLDRVPGIGPATIDLFRAYIKI
jgi:comEA protein